MGVSNIEHIPQLGTRSGIIQKRDAFCATVDPAAHFLIPEFQFCTCGCIGSLCVDQECIGERIAIQPRRHIQITHPVLWRVTDIPGVLLRQFSNIVNLWQGSNLLYVFVFIGVLGNSRLYCARPSSTRITRSAANVLSFFAE